MSCRGCDNCCVRVRLEVYVCLSSRHTQLIGVGMIGVDGEGLVVMPRQSCVQLICDVM